MQPYLVLPSHTPSGACVDRIMEYWLRQRLSNSWVAPQWRLLKSQLETKGPGWYSPAEREERLFTNKSNRPGDGMKEALRTDGNSAVWQAWTTTQNQLRQLRQPAPPLVFPGEAEIFRDMYTQVGGEEQIISPPYTRIQEDVRRRRRKKRKQGDDNALMG